MAGVVATVCMLPFDNVKVKLQKMPSQGIRPYKGAWDCMMKSVKKEGFFKLWAGILPMFCNIGPHSIITLVSTEVLHRVLKL